MKCPKCGSKHTVKAGYKVLVTGKKPRRQCMDCGRSFYAPVPRKTKRRKE